MIVEASAPSNIALIKYMGKTDAKSNLPTNSSLSWTMNHLRTFVEIENSQEANDSWAPLARSGVEQIKLSEKGQQRFLNHFAFLKKQFGIEGQNFIVRSANNFPSDCGLASSASSFAALTLATHELALRLNKNFQAWTAEKLADLSRQGSGSSCRSLFPVWSMWTAQSAKAIELKPQDLWHSIVIVESGHKSVSSSEAHKRVTSSDQFQGRIERAEQRLNLLIDSLNQGTWAQSYELCWQEFWDMHSLFETSKPHFGYMTGGSLAVLNAVRDFWQQNSDGPIVTMDAGANVHFLWRADQVALAKDLLEALNAKYKVISSRSL